MNLRDWQALSPEEQEKYWGKITAIEQCNLVDAGASVPKGAKCELQIIKCSDTLIELKNAMKRDIQDEIDGTSHYREAATKLGALRETDYSGIFHLLSDAEHMHKMVIEALVDALDLRCGLEPSSQRGK